MKVLIVIYDFPPYVTGGSVIRTVKYIKYLKNRGFDFTVLTVKRKYLPEKDTFNEILKDVDIVYVEDPIRNIFDKVKGNKLKKNSNTLRYLGILNFGKFLIKWALNNVLFPDSGYIWYRKAFAIGENLINTKNFDLIYSTFPEPSGHWLSYKLAKKHQKKLILDYRDLWSTNPIFKKIRLVQFIIRIQEKRILNYAKAVIFVTEMAKELYLKKKLVKEEKTHLIWNGFDPDDFQERDIKLEEDFIDKTYFNFTYTGNTGNLHKPRRNPKHLIDAFDQFAKSNNHVRLNFIGNLPLDVRKYIERIDSIKNIPTVPHSYIPQILKDSDVLIAMVTKEEDITSVAGKTYEYMAAEKYIVALAEKDSMLSRVIQKYKYGTVAKPDSSHSILQTLENTLDKINNEMKEKPDALLLRDINRQISSDKLAKILRTIKEEI